MKKVYFVTGLIVLNMSCSTFVNAALFTFEGNINYHNDVVQTQFTLDETSSDVRVWTDSHMNGENFDPITALWEKIGSDYSLIAQNDDNQNIDPSQTFYDSGFALSSLAAGEYLFTVATFNNFVNGNLLSEGFNFDSESPILLSDWDQPASTTNMGTFYRVNLAGVTSAIDPSPTPLPAAAFLLLPGIVGVVGYRRKKKVC